VSPFQVPAPLPETAVAEPPFSPAAVEELLLLVVKAARAHQLYLPNNPIYRGAISTLRAGFAPIWAETDEISLVVSETDIRWCDVSVHKGVAKSSDSLAWLFFKDGLRELRIAKGFEEEEVVKFLDLIQRARKNSPDDDDLVTMLWEVDFAFLTYRYVDLLSDGGASDLAGATEGDQPAASADAMRQGAEEAVAQSTSSGVVNMADFDATLYFLDDNEIEYVHGELRREYLNDLRVNVVSALLDIFEKQTDAVVRAEVIGNVSTVMVYLLTAGHFRGVAHLLREARAAADRATDVSLDQKQQLGELPARLSASEPLTQLLQSLDESTTLPPPEDLGELFDQLRPTALATVFVWLTRIQNERLRPVLESAAGRLAAANTNELVRLIQASEREVAGEAIRRSGALKTQAAVPALGQIMLEGDVERRQLAVQSLSEIGSPGALQALEKTIEDTDREVRITAVRTLTAKSYRPVLSRLDAVVKGRAVREADLTEKMAFFEGYGSLCGDGGVEYLDSMLNGKGFLGRREEPEVRACAAIALGRVGTAKALAALQRASNEKDVVVRNAVSRALRGTGGAR
jgi:HEAT repeats